MKQKNGRNGCLTGCLTGFCICAVLAALTFGKIWRYAVKHNWKITVSSETSSSVSEPEPVQSETAPAEPEPAEKPAVQPDPMLTDLIYQMLSEGTLEFEFDAEQVQCDSPEQLPDVLNASFNAVKEKHRELFYIGGYGAGLPPITDDGSYADTEYGSMNILVSEKYENMPVHDMLREMEQAADEILAQIPANSSDYDRALFVHDYLVSHTVYDIAALRDDDTVETDLSYTVYGALVKHKAVCSGYASAFQYLMQKLYIPCGYYTGTSNKELPENLRGNSNGHAWNSIELNGNTYWVDVTWDDPVTPDGEDFGGPVRHKYCFTDTETLLQDHIFDNGYTKLPSCTDRTLNDRLRQEDLAKGISY